MADEPFCYVAEDGGRWRGVIAGDMPSDDIGKFYRDFAGSEIWRLPTREDWLAYMERVPCGMGKR